MKHAACAVCAFAIGEVSPRDGSVALRSFARRYTELLAPPPDRDEDPDRRRAVVAEHADAAAQAIAQAAAALRQTLVEDEPALDAVPAETALPGLDAIDRLRAASEQLAALADRTHGSEWTRPARRRGEILTALDVFDEGVHAGVHELRLASYQLD